MEPFKQSKFLTAAALFLSIAGFAPHLSAQPLDGIPELAAASLQEKLYIERQILEYTASILKVPPAQALSQKQILSQDILDLSEKDTTEQEKAFLLKFADMVEKKTLRKNITQFIENTKSSSTPLGAKIRETPQVNLDYAVETLASSIEAVVRLRGLTSDSKQNSYLEWSSLSALMEIRLDQSLPGKENVLALSGSQWLKTENAEFLIDGEASFAKRELLMNTAQSSINILTWSVYDDLTGTELADLVIQLKKKNRNLKVRIMVDGQVAQQAGRNAQLSRMEKAGAEVIRWFSQKNSFMGQHRKMIVVDNQHLVAGGLNYGDVYSHKNPDLKIARWRDTDIYLKGAGAEEGNQLFAKLWNDQLSEQKKLKYAKMKITNLRSAQNESGVDVAILNHDPQEPLEGSTIMMTILKSIREAKNTIDIQNAYIILFPALKVEIQKAIRERNVKVRILTNSAQSVDEPIVSIPILRSVLEFVKMGAEVYVKKNATLHSKLIVVDSEFSMIMSYNLHPRSERVEGEMAVAVRDSKFATDLLEIYKEDISESKAQRINTESDLVLPNSPVSIPTLRLFFDML